MSLICLSVQLSMVMERTKEMCTPRLRCCPEHSRQMKAPNETEAHCGFGAGQSAHTCAIGETEPWLSQ